MAQIQPQQAQQSADGSIASQVSAAPVMIYSAAPGSVQMHQVMQPAPQSAPSQVSQQQVIQMPIGPVHSGQQLFTQPQLQQLRAQIMAYKNLSKGQPLPDHIKLAVEGKKPLGPPIPPGQPAAPATSMQQQVYIVQASNVLVSAQPQSGSILQSQAPIAPNMAYTQAPLSSASSSIIVAQPIQTPALPIVTSPLRLPLQPQTTQFVSASIAARPPEYPEPFSSSLTSTSVPSIPSQPILPTPSATSAAVSGMMMQQTVVNQLAQRTRRIAPIAKPPGIDPLEIARERENCIKAAIGRRIDILSSFLDHQKRPPPPPELPPPSVAPVQTPQTAPKPSESTAPASETATTTTTSTSGGGGAVTTSAADSSTSANSAEATDADAKTQSEANPASAASASTTETATTSSTTTATTSTTITTATTSSVSSTIAITGTAVAKPSPPPAPVPKSTLMKAEIEMRALRLLEYQKYVRMQVLSTIRRDTTLETALLPQAYKRPKRFSLKEARQQEKLEARMRAEEERRKQRLHQDFLAKVVQHAKDFKVTLQFDDTYSNWKSNYNYNY